MWVRAARPRTLAASAAPVFTGSGLAASRGEFDLLPAAACLVAAALIEGAERKDLGYAGGGLMDTTRVASSDPDLWCDIYDSNREEVCRALDEHISLMRRVREMVDDNNFEELHRLLDRARRKRDELMAERADFNRKRKEGR